MKPNLSTWPAWPNWLKLPLLAVALAALHSTPARADMWGYVDAQGVTHFSALQLDERYELFFRGGESFATGQGDNSATPGGGGRRGAAAPARLTSYFELSSGYKAVRHLLREASDIHGIDYELLQALIATESGFNTQAVSPKGAIGLMQLIPPTAARYGVKADKNAGAEKKLTDPRTNIRAGSSYLSYLIKLFPGEIELAIAAYNAGEGAVQRAGNKIPNYPETKNYVKTVMQLYTSLKPAGVARGSIGGSSGNGGRVRMEMMGGARGRASLPVSLDGAGAITEGVALPIPH
ncbi:MAG: Lytic transglycosylase, catalytic [Polaromonas sp.]|nr:Lytic transglycosylase, catalytic [Polaromonas sp.]